MLNAVKIWIWLSTWVVASGWILSVFHELNLAGYGMAFGFAVILFFLCRAKQVRPHYLPWFQPSRKRFLRMAPLLFLVLALFALLGGSWYAPSNGGSAAYRIPRVMEWLASAQWHWIHVFDARLNIAGCGLEWFFAPLILLTGSDRLLFLPNWISFLLLPGLIFSVFIWLRISPRVAWWWMWLLPSGWCFAMQAGSTINDSFAAVYALAAVDFALRARESRKNSDLWLSLLAAALATGVKQSDILLAVPGLIAAAPNLRLLLKRPLASSAIVSLCLLISALPNIIFNLKETSNWAGVSGPPWNEMEPRSPFWGIVGNIFCLAAQNLKPPFFPFSSWWNAEMRHFIQTPFGAHFTGFEDFGRLSFGAGESNVALGAGLALLILVSFFAARLYATRSKVAGGTMDSGPVILLLKWVPWLLLLVFMAKTGTFQNGRQLASYYILLIPSLLAAPGQPLLVRQRWWRFIALLVMGLAAALLVVSRERPLFPSQIILRQLKENHPQSKLVSNIFMTYAITPAFEEERKYLREVLPLNEAVIGYAAGIDGEAGSSLWLPYGQRRIQYVTPDDTVDGLHSTGIHYVVVDSEFLEVTRQALPPWLARYQATVVKQWHVLLDPYAPPRAFYLVRLD
jgi:hypothetical protein